jgi:hypothetical protein
MAVFIHTKITSRLCASPLWGWVHRYRWACTWEGSSRESWKQRERGRVCAHSEGISLSRTPLPLPARRRPHIHPSFATTIAAVNQLRNRRKSIDQPRERIRTDAGCTLDVLSSILSHFEALFLAAIDLCAAATLLPVARPPSASSIKALACASAAMLTPVLMPRPSNM